MCSQEQLREAVSQWLSGDAEEVTVCFLQVPGLSTHYWGAGCEVIDLN